QLRADCGMDRGGDLCIDDGGPPEEAEAGDRRAEGNAGREAAPVRARSYSFNVFTRSAAREIFSFFRNRSSSLAMRKGERGAQKVAVATWAAEAPAIRNSAASTPVAMPPRPTTGIFTACTACKTKRRAMGLIAGPERPPNPAPSRGRRVRASMAKAIKVLTSE